MNPLRDTMIYRFDGFELDTRLFELRLDGRHVSLEPQAFDLLAFLIEHRDRVVTKDELIDKLWPERFISETALTTRIKEVRQALGDSGTAQRYIQTSRGRGYRFAREVFVESEPVDVAPTQGPVTAPVNADEQQIRFCKTADGVQLAYAVSGQGPPFVKAANWLSHLEYDWQSPVWHHWLRELSRDHTLVRYDERGCGLSEQQPQDFSFEGWVRDLEAVVDTLGLETFPLLGISQGGPVAMAYAHRHPERVSHLILYGTYARGRARRPRAKEEIEEREALLTLTRHGWGRSDATYRQIFTAGFIPGASAEQMQWFNDLQRESTSPENAVRFMQAFDEVSVEDIISELHIPALVLHARNDRRVPFEEGRRLAAALPDARFVPLDGESHILLEHEPAWLAFLQSVRRFLGLASDTVVQTPAPEVAGPDLLTVMFTDIEASTELTRQLGDANAQELLREHNAIVREALKQRGGREVKHTGDGIMASFTLASAALDCAIDIQRAHAQREAHSPLRVRIGMNAGEPVTEDADLFGTSVQLARRICDQATAGQILVSDVVRQIAAGKGHLFTDVGEVLPKGFDEVVRLYELRWER